MLARRRQLNFSQLRDGAFPSPDLPQGADIAARVMANISLG